MTNAEALATARSLRQQVQGVLDAVGTVDVSTILGALWFGLWLLRHGFREFEQLERPVKKPVAFRCLFCGERKVDGPRGACWVCRVRRAASAWGRSR